MSLKQFQDIRQSSVMTQDLQESVKILQYSNLDLMAYVGSQLEINPFLSIADPESETSYADEYMEEIDKDSAQDLSFEEYVSSAMYEDNSPYNKTEKKSEATSDNYDLEEREISFREFVYEQINLDIACNRKKIIALYLAEMLDDNGYIDLNYEYIINLLKCEREEIDSVLLIMQNFEPTGIFARSLSECLSLQLKEKQLFDADISCLLDNLELLAKMDFATIKKKCNINFEKQKEYLSIIKTLNPKPGNIFGRDIVQVIHPDMFLRKCGSGWILEPNNDFVPRVLVNKTYYQELKTKVREKSSRKYFSGYYNNANWLVNSLNHRAIILMKVAVKIVEIQQSFFDKGIDHLIPMSLQNIASEVGLSTSTISRVTSNKYISTPIGIFELKYFFSSSVPGLLEGGESNKKAKHLIKNIITKEQAEKIYTDQEIVEILKSEGIEISRRTVTKYRESMSIPSSSERKRSKRVLSSA